MKEGMIDWNNQNHFCASFSERMMISLKVWENPLKVLKDVQYRDEIQIYTEMPM